MKPSRRSKFFLYFAILASLVTIAGFSKTFIYPSYKGTFEAPLSVYLHGALCAGWVLLFLIQTILVARKKSRIHMRLGKIGIFLAAGLLISMFPLSVYTAGRDLELGLGDSAYSGIVGTVLGGVMFFLFVCLGIYWRKKPVIHKRYLTLATIILLWPAWFRLRHYFPSVPNPEIWFALVMADSLIIFCWIWDIWKQKRIHPSWLYGGIFIIVEQSLELYFFDSPPWRQLAKSIYLAIA